MNEVFLCDAVRTPFGRYGGALSSVRTDDLAAIPIRALIARNPDVDWSAVDDVILGCANQAGEDNRNVGRMALLLAGLPEVVPGTTINRLCGSSLDAIATAARAIKSGESDLIITVTAGNAAGINDGAGAVLLASEHAIIMHQLKPRARVVAAAVAGVTPRIMGIGPVPATQKVLGKAGLKLSQIDVIELNEAFRSAGTRGYSRLGFTG